MPIKKPIQTAKIFDVISKALIYFLIFLLPIFFLPWTANTLDFNKQALLIVFVFLAFFVWMIKALVAGELTLNMSGLHILVLIFFLIFLFSTIFSEWKFGSFWGWPQITTESLLTLIGLLLLYFLISNVFSKKEIVYSFITLSFSAILVMIFGILQVLGKFILPFNFAKAVSFNTIGTLTNLGLFAATLLPLIICLLLAGKKILRIISAVALIISVGLFILLNSSTVWIAVAVGSALIFAFGAPKRDFFDNRWLVLPMLLIALSLFYGFFRFQITGLPRRPIEVNLTQKATFDIVLQTLKEKPVLGSGPGTFIFDFDKYKSPNLNQSPFWNVQLDVGASKFLTLLADLGVLGGLAVLALIVFFLIYGIKFLVKNSNKIQSKDETVLEDKFIWHIALGVFVGFFTLSVIYFLAYPSLSLDFVYFLLMAGLVSLIYPDRKKIILKPSSLLTLGATFTFTLIFIFGLGLLILAGQRYAAEINYFSGIKKITEGDVDGSINYLGKAASISPAVDLYWRDLSQIYLQKFNETLADKSLSKEQATQKIQFFINNSVNAAKIATDANPRNMANWLNRGSIFQGLIGVVPGAKDWAIKCYDEAIELEPLNPYLPAQKGISLMKEAVFLAKDKTAEKEALYTEAKTQFDKAIELKPDYAAANFQLAMIYQAQGETEEAIRTLEDTKKVAPFDAGLAFQIGLLYYQNKDYQKAQAELERAVGIDQNYANALYFLGLTYDQLGDRGRAIEKFEKVAELNPGSEEVRKILNNLKNWRPALEGIGQETPPQAPIEEKPE